MNTVFLKLERDVAFEERGQISIGQHLYQETLGPLHRYDGQSGDTRLISAAAC